MRAVKSVLVMAGSLKRAEPDVSKDVILIRAMQDSELYLEKFTTQKQVIEKKSENLMLRANHQISELILEIANNILEGIK